MNDPEQDKKFLRDFCEESRKQDQQAFLITFGLPLAFGLFVAVPLINWVWGFLK